VCVLVVSLLVNVAYNIGQNLVQESPKSADGDTTHDRRPRSAVWLLADSQRKLYRVGTNCETWPNTFTENRY
jgi:hypothetical protein